MMKVAIIGSKERHTLERIYHDCLAGSGVDVQLLDVRDKWNNKRNSFADKVVSKLLPRLFCRDINKWLLDSIGLIQPDAIIIFKGMEIFPKTLEVLSNSYNIVMYNPDHPYIYSGVGSGNEWMTRSIQYYDLYITYTEDIACSLRHKGVPDAIVPFGYSIEQAEYDAIVNCTEVNKLCFLGNGDSNRSSLLNYLADNGIPLVVYGDGWNDMLTSSIEKHDGAYGLDFWKVMRRYAVQLNIMRPHNLNSHNMRTFDIPAAGGVQLAPRTPDHEEFFTENESIVLYENMKDCLKKAKFLLELSTDDRVRIRIKAREESVNKGYSYCHRSKQLLNLLEEHFGLR